jgi:hypothetical protein
VILPNDFQFSAPSLQDFADCPRRFYLRYVEELRYPAPESSPLRDFDEQLERDMQFHHLAHQHQRGIPIKALEATIADDMVEDWWKAYRKYALVDLPKRRSPLVNLSTPLGGRRLVARYDLLAFDDDHAMIVEWKTEDHRPTRAVLQRRLQTVIYPYLLAKAGAHLNDGEPIDPTRISMVYWFPDAPQEPEVFQYSARQFESDAMLLDKLAADILQRSEDEFELTDNLDLCQFCAYRSLNNRGTTAGNLLEAELDIAREGFDTRRELSQIGEIGF